MVNIIKDKKTNNERQNIIQSPLTTGCKLRWSGMVDSSCSTNITVFQLHIFTFLFQCCDVCYDFRVEAMFGSSSISFVCRGFMFYLFKFSSFIFRWYPCSLAITWRVILVEQELSTIQDLFLQMNANQGNISIM
jgi:hypothetical protein